MYVVVGVLWAGISVCIGPGSGFDGKKNTFKKSHLRRYVSHTTIQIRFISFSIIFFSGKKREVLFHKKMGLAWFYIAKIGHAYIVFC
jgi:hypothetical protein